MQEFRTYIFERSRKKTIRRNLFYLSFLLFIAVMLVLVFIGFPGIGSIGVIFISVGIFKYMEYEDKYMGITAYGQRGRMIYISETGLTVDQTFIPFSKLEDLIIYVDEYAGMKRKFLGVHHGGNNEIRFKYNGQKTSLFYIVKNHSDFLQLESLVSKIEQQNPV